MQKIRKCRECGKRILLHNMNPQQRITRIMKDDSLCYECAYWYEILNYPLSYQEIVNNVVLRVYPEDKEPDPTKILGCRGKYRYFQRSDNTLFCSNDVWIIGKIPEHLQKHFSDTAIEITKKAYLRLVKNPNKCHARGCFDRYECMRYKIELEKESGAFNQIPSKWKIGDERCRFFLNKSEIIKEYIYPKVKKKLL